MKKKYFFLFTIINGRSVAFQPCITLGGVSWFDLAEKMFYPKKYPKKRGFFGHGPGSADFRGDWDPQF